MAAKLFLKGQEFTRELAIMTAIQRDSSSSSNPLSQDGGNRRHVLLAMEHFTEPFAVLVFPLADENLSEAFDLEDMMGVLEQRRRMIGSFGVDAARGIAFLHARNIVHLDIKPGNVVIFHKGRPEEHAKVIDLGLAKEHQIGTSCKVLVQGTVPYMSPEIHRARFERVYADPSEADVWAMGCLIWAVSSVQRSSTYVSAD